MQKKSYLTPSEAATSLMARTWPSMLKTAVTVKTAFSMLRSDKKDFLKLRSLHTLNVQ